MAKHVIQTLPLDVSEQVREQLRRLLMHFEELRVVAPPPGAWLPSVDLCEMSDAIIIRVDVPGVGKDDLRLTVLDNVLRIEGRKQQLPDSDSRKDKPLRFLCLERSYGRFERTVALQWPVEVDNISARLHSGVLEIRLPKAGSCGREVTIPISTD